MNSVRNYLILIISSAFGNLVIHAHKIVTLHLLIIILIIYVTNIIRDVFQMDMDVKNLFRFFVLKLRQII